MAAQPGNQWWRLRSSHGREILFTNPELLWEAAMEYFEATDGRKWLKKDWVGKDAREVDRECDTPYTKTGLFLYLHCNDRYFNTFRKTLQAGNVERTEDFLTVISRIEQIIYTQKIEGATVGAFNANIVSRELGLKDATDITTNGHKIDTANPVINIYNSGPPLKSSEEEIDEEKK